MSPLHPLVVIALMLAVAAAARADARRLQRVHAVTLDTALRKAPYVLVGLGVMALMLVGEISLIFWTDFGWALPLPIEYAYTQIVESVILAVFAFTFGLTLTIAFDTKRADRGNLLALALFVSIGVPVGIDRSLRPIYPDLGETERDGIVMQTSGDSCAPASAANLLRTFGIWTTERELAKRFRTTKLGTSSAQVIYGLAELGLDCKRRELSTAVPLEYPAILLVDGSFVGHAVTLLGPAKIGGWRIADPLIGEIIVPDAEVQQKWRGHAVTCVRSAASGRR